MASSHAYLILLCLILCILLAIQYIRTSHPDALRPRKPAGTHVHSHNDLIISREVRNVTPLCRTYPRFTASSQTRHTATDHDASPHSETTPIFKLTGFDSYAPLGNGVPSNTFFRNHDFFNNEIHPKARKVGCLKQACFVLSEEGHLFLSGLGDMHGSGIGYLHQTTVFHRLQAKKQDNASNFALYFIEWVEAGEEHMIFRGCSIPDGYNMPPVASEYDAPYCPFPFESALFSFGSNRRGALGVAQVFGSRILDPHEIRISKPSVFVVRRSFNLAVGDITLYEDPSNHHITSPRDVFISPYAQSLLSLGNATGFPSSMIYFWGQDGSRTPVISPTETQMQAIHERKDRVVQVDLDSVNAYALAESGRLYVLPVRQFYMNPWKLSTSLPATAKVARMAFSENGGLVLTHDGTLYAAYNNEFTILQIPTVTDASHIRYLNSLYHYRSFYHAEEGKLYLWSVRPASSSTFQYPILGAKWTDEIPLTPRPTPHEFLSEARTLSSFVSDGLPFTIGIFGENQKVRIYGSNRDQALGQSEKVTFVEEFIPAETFFLNPHQVVDIVISSNHRHMFALMNMTEEFNDNSEHLTVYQWGGFAQSVDEFAFIPVPIKHQGNVRRIRALAVGVIMWEESGGISYANPIQGAAIYPLAKLKARQVKQLWAPPIANRDDYVWFQQTSNKMVVAEIRIPTAPVYVTLPMQDAVGVAMVKIRFTGMQGEIPTSALVVSSSARDGTKVWNCTLSGVTCIDFGVTNSSIIAQPIVQVASSLNSFVLLLAADGTLYGFGSNAHYELLTHRTDVTSEQSYKRIHPIRINYPDFVENVAFMGASENREFYAVSGSGKMWVWRSSSTWLQERGVMTVPFQGALYPNDTGRISAVRFAGLNAKKSNNGFLILLHESMCSEYLASDWRACGDHGVCIRNQCECFEGYVPRDGTCKPPQWKLPAIFLWTILITLLVLCACCCVIVICGAIISCIGVRVMRFHKKAKKSIERLRLLENEFKVELMDMDNADPDAVRLNIDQNMFQISMSELDIKELIGSGGSGASVVRAEYQNMSVAVKLFRVRDPFMLRQFVQEVNTFCRLRHDNIVQFIGFVDESHRFGVVMEYCPNGSLATLVEGTSKDSLTMKERKSYLLQVAKGMHYLHSQSIIHRDLKMENTLVSKYGVSKVMDFGLSRLKDDEHSERMTQAVGSAVYTAPEIYTAEHYDEKCDVFSYGIMMYEMMAHTTKPYGNINTAFIGAKVANDPKFRPDTNKLRGMEGMQDDVWLIDLMERCWSHSSEERPSFSEIIEIMERSET